MAFSFHRNNKLCFFWWEPTNFVVAILMMCMKNGEIFSFWTLYGWCVEFSILSCAYRRVLLLCRVGFENPGPSFCGANTTRNVPNRIIYSPSNRFVYSLPLIDLFTTINSLKIGFFWLTYSQFQPFCTVDPPATTDGLYERASFVIISNKICFTHAMSTVTKIKSLEFDYFHLIYL